MMKKLKTTGYLFALLLVVISCNKVKPSKVEKSMTDGTWKVTLFSEDGENETSYFSGYVFTFNDGGTVSAVGSTTISGTWSVSKSSSSSDDEVHFNLSFPDTNNFDELSDDWHILNYSDNSLELEDVSGGNGGIDKLTFSKI